MCFDIDAKVAESLAVVMRKQRVAKAACISLTQEVTSHIDLGVWIPVGMYLGDPGRESWDRV